ncbi:hypothetical protein HYALB_00006414 [Hymenoscyphus albidus]|uniref:Uncharacterized protein n=1 Tax=Hymenoscyphus albidus TaxID=595503 RepID=A0A9N9LKC5_9HELO|nr:hypothetical protein HYALB_00006414 [Hymenoscyphus albidus]
MEESSVWCEGRGYVGIIWGIFFSGANLARLFARAPVHKRLFLALPTNGSTEGSIDGGTGRLMAPTGSMRCPRPTGFDMVVLELELELARAWMGMTGLVQGDDWRRERLKCGANDTLRVLKFVVMIDEGLVELPFWYQDSNVSGGCGGAALALALAWTTVMCSRNAHCSCQRRSTITRTWDSMDLEVADAADGTVVVAACSAVHGIVTVREATMDQIDRAWDVCLGFTSTHHQTAKMKASAMLSNEQ